MTRLAVFTKEGEEGLALGKAAHSGHQGFLAQSLCRRGPWAELELSHLETSVTHSKELNGQGHPELGKQKYRRERGHSASTS